MQGLTLNEIVVDMKGGHFSPGQAYVAFSRVKTLHGLHILKFNAETIKSSSDVQNEIARLTNKLLPPTPQLQFLSLPHNYVTICLLKVRSLVAKLPNIEQDMCLRTANVLCFCETWLTASQTSPSILSDQMVIRCDRQTGNNKGGTVICVPHYMQPSGTCTFISNSIEVACTTLTLDSASQIQIFVLYRSPNVPLQALLTTMSRVLIHASNTDMPTVILGDFNKDIVSQPNSSIVNLMSNRGYTQLVMSPTTAKGTLRDQNRPTNDIVVQVHYTYYSDHDAVYCSIPI